MSGNGSSPRRHGDTENDAPKKLTADEQTILDVLTLGSQVRERVHEKSAFLEAFHDAMAAGHRNENGDPDESGEHVTWLSIMGYMTLLDMIGRCFAPKNGKHDHNSGNLCFVKDALERFSDEKFSPDQLNALHALRCSLAHDYSAVRNERGPYHVFDYAFDQPGETVGLPEKPWDGKWATAKDHITHIGVHQLVRLVHDLFGDVQKMATRGELECVLPGGVEELTERYRVVTTESPSVSPCLRGKKGR